MTVDTGVAMRTGHESPRCGWAGGDAAYLAYHDTEWGRPVLGDDALFERMTLEAFQSGLAWITILRKREAFRRALDDFAPDKIARYSKKKVAALMQDQGIVRNRAKIEGTIASARAWLDIMENGAGFGPYLWDFVGGKPIVNRHRRMADIPAETELSRAISKDLKARGFKFCGPTIIYAFMQATGMVNDHLTSCPRHAACVKLGRASS